MEAPGGGTPQRKVSVPGVLEPFPYMKMQTAQTTGASGDLVKALLIDKTLSEAHRTKGIDSILLSLDSAEILFILATEMTQV